MNLPCNLEGPQVTLPGVILKSSLTPSSIFFPFFSHDADVHDDLGNHVSKIEKPQNGRRDTYQSEHLFWTLCE